MTTSRLVVMAMLWSVLASSAPAQQPAIDSSAVAMRYAPLPVLDDYGEVIAEDLIRATMRNGWRKRAINLVAGTLGGAALFALLSPDSPSNTGCSIYDPCTPREEFYINNAPLWGLGVGFLVGLALPDGKVDRWKAVELLRAQRRAARATGGAGNPP